MAKFKKSEKSLPAVSTSSLPDIVFMLLFFFMVSTTMREQEMLVQVKVPSASEAVKLEKKSLASYIYIGPPTKQHAAKYGTAPRIQLNDNYATEALIGEFIAAERDKLSEADRSGMTVNLKADQDTKMGIVQDVKQELRRANALLLLYNARKEAPADR